MPIIELKTVTLDFLYENKLGKFFLNEEKYSLWSCCRDPYEKNLISLAADELELEEESSLRSRYVRSVPMSKLYRGLLIQGYSVSPKVMRTLEQFEVRESDLFVVSYPRSGTTWTEEIVSAIHSEFNTSHLRKKKIHERVIHLEVGRPVGHKKFLKSLRSPRLLGTHLPYEQCPQELRDIKCKVGVCVCVN